MHYRLPAVAALISVIAAQASLAQDIDYTLINSSSSTLMEFYTSPTSSAGWGDDLLGVNVLLSGQEATVLIADGRRTCDYDLLFVFDDGTELTDTVDICDLASYEITD